MRSIAPMTEAAPPPQFAPITSAPRIDGAPHEFLGAVSSGGEAAAFERHLGDHRRRGERAGCPDGCFELVEINEGFEDEQVYIAFEERIDVFAEGLLLLTNTEGFTFNRRQWGRPIRQPMRCRRLHGLFAHRQV